MRHTALKKEIDDQGDIALTILGDLTSSFLKSVLDSSPDCIKIIGVDGCLTYMSENGQEIMEVDDFAMISGRHWASLWPEDNRHLIQDALTQVKHGRACRFEAHCPTAKGRNRWWDVSVSPVIDEEGELPGPRLCFEL
ncbi:MAG: PAS domain-containing protein, partial [Pseudomonadota bacterium]